MSRLEIRPAAVVAQLKDLLRDRYRRDGSELPLLKEIVQNADDAGATTLDFVVLENGVPGAANPLLRGAALACINDGRFTDEDKTAISSFGLTSKAEERSSIGRFGVGQKSVFHLAEAFFFIARPGPGRSLEADVIDPWATVRPDWNEFSVAEQERVLAALCQWLNGPSWFVLYLPLRTEDHRRAYGKEITSHYPHVENLENEFAEDQEVPCLLPQLENLRRISSWRVTAHSADAQPLGDASVPVGAGRLSRRTDEPFARGFRGEVTFSSRGGPPQRIPYFCHERCVADAEIRELPNDRQWPKRTVETGDGDSKDVPEKTRAHGAVTWVRTPGPGDVRMSWAVFLPLSSDVSRVRADGLQSDWRVLLHGYFFPDSGRRALAVSANAAERGGSLDGPARSEEIHERWNKLIVERATVPSLVPALEIALTGCSVEEGERLGHAVAGSSLWRAHRAAAAGDGVLAWGPTLDGDGVLRTSPRRHSPGTWLLPLPRPRQSEFSDLAELIRCWTTVERGGTVALVWEDGPQLAPDGAWEPWDSARVAAALDAIDVRLLSKPAALNYFLRAATAMHGAVDVGVPLLGILRRAFRRSVLSGRGSEEWTALARLLPRGAVLWSSARTALLRDLARIETQVLLLPIEYAPEETAHTAPVVSMSDARLLLRQLSMTVEEGAFGEDKIIADVVSAVGVRAILADPELSGLAIFRVWSARRGKHVCVDAANLRAALDRGAAFQKKGLSAAEDLARKIAAAVPAAGDVFVVDDDDVAAAMGVRVFDEDTLKRLLLGEGTAVAGEQQRHDLLATLLGTRRSSFGLPDLQSAASVDPEVRVAMRFLVHGESEHVRDPADLLVGREGAEILELAASVLGATGDAWRVVPRVIAADLSNRWMEALGIAVLDASAVVAALERFPVEGHGDLGRRLDPAQRRLLRRVLAEAHADTLFASIAVHDTLDGLIVAAADPGVYLQGTWAVPDSLRGDVHLIGAAAEPSVAEAQRRLVPRVWCAVEQLSACLAKTEPSSYAREILDAFGAATDLPPEIRDELKRQRWLVTADGAKVAPGDVLNVDSAVDRAFRLLLPAAGRVFRAPGELLEELRRHRAFVRVMAEVALRGQSASEAVALELDSQVAEGHNPFWILASGSRERDRSFLERGITVAVLDADPTWHVIKTLAREYGEGFFEVVLPLLDTFRLKPNAARVISLLSRFVDDRSLQPSDREANRAFFLDYLRAARERPDFQEVVLPQISLLNVNDTWRRTGELARSDANLQPRYQVHPEHRAILGALPPAASQAGALAPPAGASPSARQAEKPQAEALAEYFGPWTGRVSAEAVGYFLACLGDGNHRGIAGLAERFLGASATLDGARDRIFYQLSTRQVGFERARADRARWTFTVAEKGAAIEVTSLAGTPLQALVAGAALKTLFVGDVPGAAEAPPARLVLRKLDLGEHENSELHAALGASLAALVGAAVGVELDRARFDEFWKGLGRGGQSQVTAVRNRILQQLPTYVDMLVGRRDPLFGPLSRRVDRAEQRVQEVVAEGSGLWDSARNKEVAARDAAVRELTDFVLKDARAHEALLRGVREKLGSYQYTPEQVLFELFQNADDATRDLRDLAREEEASSAASRGFVVSVDRVRPMLRVQHFGRAINRGDVSAGPQRSSRSYELDLKNMLLLHLSDKDELSTGRFGLGFKSVHLLTARPRVRSGDLSFEIVGGLVPVHVPLEGPPDPSTIVELPLESADLLRRALIRFSPCAGLLVAFARAIRRVTLDDGQRSVVEWHPLVVPGAGGVEVGTLRSLGEGRGEDGTRVLVLRGERVAVALRLGATGVERFSGVPEVWCTAPTTADWGLGYCVNAPFVLDVGRGQLATTAPDNERLFRECGAVVASALGDLADSLEAQFPDASRALGLESGARSAAEVRRAFWRSVFEQFTSFSFAHGAPDRAKLIRALHGPGAGLSALATSRRVLPTGLPGEHDVLTTAAQVSWVGDEIVSRGPVFEALRGVAPELAAMAPGSVIAHEVSSRLAAVGASLVPRATMLTFRGTVERAISTSNIISPELALAWERLKAAVESAGGFSAEAVAVLREQLGRARFRTRSGKLRVATEVLVARSHAEQLAAADRKRSQELADEVFRSSFAPDAYVLADDYAADPRIVEFFLFARQRLLSGDAAQLASWARNVEGGRRAAVVRYLACGELNGAMIEAVRSDGGLPWCGSHEELDVYASELSNSDLQVLRVRLFDLVTVEPDEPPGPDIGFVGDPGEAMRKIADWWRNRRGHWTAVYERRVYGTLGGAAEIAEKLRSTRTDERRDGWTLLLTLAACQSFGRQTDEQHSGFVRYLRSEGTPRWWNVVIGDPKKTRPEAWIGILDQWLDHAADEDQYRMWLGLFPTLYQLHRHGDVYSRLLSRAHEHPPRQFSIDLLLSPKSNPALTGAGASAHAPPLAPALGIGASWTLRELVRLEVVPRRDHLLPFCFVPRKRTLEVLAQLGADGFGDSLVASHGERSRMIFDFLRAHLDEDEASFEGAFDLPLYLIATEPGAREEALP